MTLSLKSNPTVYFWANFFGSISLIAPVMSLFYLHRGLEFSDFFILLLIIVVTMFLFEVPTGSFADKYGAKNSLLLGQLLSIAAIVMLIFAHSRWEFYILSFLSGIAITCFSGSDEALIYDSLKEQGQEHTMSKVWAKISSAKHIPAAISVVVGALIAKDLLEYQFVILILVGLFFGLVKFFTLFLLQSPSHHYMQVEKPNQFHHVKQSFDLLRKYPALLLLFMNETLVFIPLHVFNNFDQVFLTDNGLAVPLIGVLYALSSLASYYLLHKFELFQKRISTKLIITVSGIAIFLAYLTAAFINNLYVAILIFFVIRLSNVIRFPLFAQIKNDYIPSGSRATTLSVLSMIDSFFDIIIFTSLALIANLGLTAIFLGSAVVVFVGLLFPVRVEIKCNITKENFRVNPGSR